MKLDRRAKFNKVTHLLSDPRSFSRFSRAEVGVGKKRLVGGFSATMVRLPRQLLPLCARRRFPCPD